MRTMRAKMKVVSVEQTEYADVLNMEAVCRDGAYPEDGSCEDNTFARFTPSGSVRLVITNPDLQGVFSPGQKFYLDFTEAE